MNTEKFGLCLGRHNIPGVESYIFGNEIDPLDLDGMEKQAREKLHTFHNKKITLYITGLTVALISALNVCRDFNITVTLMHYDRESGNYYVQEVK